MTGVLALLQAWLRTAESLVARAPELSAWAGAGSWPAAAGAVLAGLLLLVAGIRVPRLIAFLGGAAVGWLLGASLAPALHGVAGATAVSGAAALIVALGALAGPPLYPAILGALPGALLGGQLTLMGQPAFGAAAGALALGLAGYLLRRLVLAATASAVGTILVCGALLALSPRLPQLGVLAHRPLALLAVAGVLFVAGTAFQAGTTPRAAAPPDSRDLGRL